MAGHQIPSGSQGLRASGIGNPAWQGLFEQGLFEKVGSFEKSWLFENTCFFGAKSPEKRGYLRGNGPVGVRFPLFSPDFAGSRRMSSSDPTIPRHIPVLGHQAVALLTPHDGGIYVDATFGAGGYSRMILDIPGTRVIGIDRDRTAILGGFDLVDQSAGRLTLVEDQFSNLAGICVAQGQDRVDGIVMDIGVSSMQLDQADRGFSFRLGGPLDMRMGQDGPTAADVVARASEADLANIIYIFGEERHSRAVARAIVAARKEAPIATTRELADIVGKVVWSKPGEIHPATRTFQALRIFVNGELDELHLALAAAERALKPGGRLAVVSFHSLEDRIVKNFFGERAKAGGRSRHLPEIAQAAPSFVLLTKRPVIADDDEIAANPRARSAKLRGAERSAAPAHDAADLPAWPVLADVMRGG
jgi:16S rRNA (cytosine1402-N4)-methyltransferase